jgi:hypothetical protein
MRRASAMGRRGEDAGSEFKTARGWREPSAVVPGGDGRWRGGRREHAGGGGASMAWVCRGREGHGGGVAGGGVAGGGVDVGDVDFF